MKQELSPQPTEALLPSLDNLSDEQYLEQSRIFGRQWVDYVADGEGIEQPPSAFLAVDEILRQRSISFNQLPEDERAATLINQQRVYLVSSANRSGRQPPVFEPLTGELLERGGVRVKEVKAGVPEVITNASANKELFDSPNLTFCTPGVMYDNEDSLPFVVVPEVKEGGSMHTPAEIHEISHVLWHTAAHNKTIPGLVRERDAQDGTQWAFLMMQDEGVSISTAGESQFTHNGVIASLRSANIAGANGLVATYQNLNELYRFVISKIPTEDLTLGIMQASNIQDLNDHFERMADIVKEMPDRERDDIMEWLD